MGTITKPQERRFSEVCKGFTCFRDDDVIMAKITPCMENGKAAIARGLTNGLGFGSTEFHVLRSLGAVLPEYVYFLIRQESFRRAAAARLSRRRAHGLPRQRATRYSAPALPVVEATLQGGMQHVFRRFACGTNDLSRARGSRRARRCGGDGGGAVADPIPPGGQAENMKPIGFSALGGRYGAFKMAIKHPSERPLVSLHGAFLQSGLEHPRRHRSRQSAAT